jgi:DNA processing protein
VFAVPGSPLDPRAKGANRLIRDGALLTESAEDVLAVLRPMLALRFQEAATSPPDDLPLARESDGDSIRALLQEKLSPAPVDIDELVRQCGVPAADIVTILLELELAGRVLRHPGNRVSSR